MNRSLMTKMGLLVLVTILTGAGCAPLPYPGSYYEEPEIIVVPEPYPVPIPVPMPVPVPGPELGGSTPPPQRHTPLTKPPSTGNPRIKTPRGDRSPNPSVIARGGSGPSKGGSRGTKKPVIRR